jgi:hypothetical protein
MAGFIDPDSEIVKAAMVERGCWKMHRLAG